MSILIENGVNAPLVIPDFFSAQPAYPFTIVYFAKVTGFTTSGTRSFRVAQIEKTSAEDLFRAQVVQATTSRRLEATAFVTSSGSATLALDAELENKWKPSANTFVSTGMRRAYSTDVDGDIVSAENNFGRAVAGAVNLRLAGIESWTSDIYLERIGIYNAELTELQILEFADTGAVAALTPYALWDTLADWGEGQIQDISGNARHITPPAAWLYSSDNPDIATVPDIDSVNAGTLRAGSTGNTITFSAAFTPTSITMGGLTATSIASSSATVFTFAWPALADGVSHPGFGTRTISASDGTDTITLAISYLPQTGYTYQTLAGTLDTSTDASVIKDFSPAAVVTDQIAHSTDTTVNEDGTASTTITGGQTAWHWDQSTTTIYSYEILTGSADNERAITARKLTASGFTVRSLTSRRL